MSVRPRVASSYLADFDETQYGKGTINLSVFESGGTLIHLCIMCIALTCTALKLALLPGLATR